VKNVATSYKEARKRGSIAWFFSTPRSIDNRSGI
jgi:hypothetical protein